ncbi:MAG: 2OG-Fe(II) oxygenase [Proteobacteria bacterium]|nr:2OG-Fe(II) oxygenase [Pseudomonadota bacterium]
MAGTLIKSIDTAEGHAKPYAHWFMSDCLPAQVADEITNLPFPAPTLGGVSGKRELHNGTRKYFDVENRAKYAAVEAFSQAFQSRAVTDRIQSHFGTKLAGSYLRLEYAQDTDDFWLEPHTDLGVKVFTMLLYLSKDAAHRDLGTDIYDTEKKHVGRSPFVPNGAMVFVPSTITYHGFEPRKIQGIRKSVIINYVTNEWRAREQLSFPDAPIAA